MVVALSHRLSTGPVLAVVAVTAALVALPLLIAGRPFELRLATLIFLFATMGQGWNVLGGYAGQISIGHGLYFGLGAYTSAMLSVKFGVNAWLGLPVAILLPALCAVLIGIPCFRLRGHYFVIATLVVAESAFQIFSVWDWVGGATGLEIPIQRGGWLSFQFNRDKTPYYYIALAMLVLVTAGIWWLKNSRLGFLLRAVRDDENAARSLGFSPPIYKSLAMAFSAAILGAAGVFQARYVLFVDPPSVLGLQVSVLIALFAILGGSGTLVGPILGAAVLVPLSEYSRIALSGSGRNVDLLVYGFLIMLIAAFQPEGLIGLVHRWRHRVHRIGVSTKG